MSKVTAENTVVGKDCFYTIVPYDARNTPTVLAKNYSKESLERFSNRYCVISTETGEILDDAQGWGYTTPEKARKCYEYKCNMVRKQLKCTGNSPYLYKPH